MNKIIRIYIFLFVITSYSSYAQDMVNYKNLKQRFLYQTIVEEYNHTPVNYFVTPIDDYTTSLFKLSCDHNGLKTPNQYKNSKDIFLGVSGLFHYENTVFNGKMSYTKNYLEQIGWNSTQLYPLSEVEKSPYYYLSYQQGNWDNQRYELSGSIVRSFSNNFFVVGLINYDAYHYFRIKDPKPELKYLNIQGEGSIYYNADNHLFGVSVLKGYRDNEININYTGTASDINIPFNENLYNRLSVGYGFLTSAKFLTAEEREERIGGKLHYLWHNEQEHWNALLQCTQSKNTFYQYYKELYPAQGYYVVNNYMASIRNTDFKNKYSASVVLDYKSGHNYSFATLGTNYKASSLSIKSEYNFLLGDYELGGILQYYSLKKKDFTVLNSTEFRNIKLGVNFSKNINRNFWCKVNSSYSFNINKKYLFSDNTNKFVKEVLYPNFAKQTLPKISIKNTLAYSFKIKKQTLIDIGVHANLGYYFNAKKYLFMSYDVLDNYFGIFLKTSY
ncbi:MAG: hypothetical protein KGV44_03065 [Flavobacteriaceae bacterium]|nr:hypothetical protein [Flavobacteriaceae bacterium]